MGASPVENDHDLRLAMGPESGVRLWLPFSSHKQKPSLSSVFLLMLHRTASGNSIGQERPRPSTSSVTGPEIHRVTGALNSLVDTPRQERSSYQDFEYRDGPSHQHQTIQRLINPSHNCQNQLSLNNHCAGTLVSPGQAYLIESIFSLALPSDSPNGEFWSPQRSGLMELSTLDDSDEPDALEDVQGAVVGFLSLDRNVESNSIAFILQVSATWISCFAYEPLRIVHLVRNYTFQVHVLGEEIRHLLSLTADVANGATQSAEYNPAESPSFSETEAIFQQRLTEAGTRVESTRSLDRQYATKAMLL
ncbi:unnamed protein product, partial [Rhizoctonia solani]